MHISAIFRIVAVIIAILSFIPQSAHAYIGPGAGLSAIGAFLAVIAAIILAIFGFIWYPVKRLIRAFKKTDDESAEESDS